jgi:hypothetical protein
MIKVNGSVSSIEQVTEVPAWVHWVEEIVENEGDGSSTQTPPPRWSQYSGGPHGKPVVVQILFNVGSTTLTKKSTAADEPFESVTIACIGYKHGFLNFRLARQLTHPLFLFFLPR